MAVSADLSLVAQVSRMVHLFIVNMNFPIFCSYPYPPAGVLKDWTDVVACGGIDFAARVKCLEVTVEESYFFQSAGAGPEPEVSLPVAVGGVQNV